MAIPFLGLGVRSWGSRTLPAEIPNPSSPPKPQGLAGLKPSLRPPRFYMSVGVLGSLRDNATADARVKDVHGEF